ncbi:Ig-like domain-containing protein [Muricauda sp. 334s03]|uniref:Ig-like domain-containing protein n=1 Tax=Flagellimonas yonaguniensis TaxID=3031325 RepID=A0ABT5Y250_9FLAO|nr:Ig-like domain-containing protein [[Muricauda] yonaguniensis]MDF0717418.1 Ig-like domain-containing protein [[Muricauda] yonaguniensis]
MTILLIFLSLTLSSCSKDNDLFEDTIQGQIEDELDENGDIIPSISFEAKDDEFTISGAVESTVLDVLKNDDIPEQDLESYQIVAVSDALEGGLMVNDDNTITYSPHSESANKAGNNGRVTDQFTYTLEVRGKGNQGKKEKEATVVVNTEYGSTEMGELKAFPGAEGYGKFTTGGRGGIVYHVTNLNNDGQGSLRYGMESIAEPRTIVFDVSGYIDIDTPLKIRYGYGDVTIAGQTAPGDGITIRGASIWVHDSNVIVRYLKIRPGVNAYNPDSNYSAGDPDWEPDDAFRIRSYKGDGDVTNVIVDHCTFSWSHDSIIDIEAPTNPSVVTSEITIQNCLLAENLSKRFGMLVYRAYNVSIYRNIFYANRDRVPAISSLENEGVEVVNNMMHLSHWGPWFRVGNLVDFIGNQMNSIHSDGRYSDDAFRTAASDIDADPAYTSIYLNDNTDDGINADNSYNPITEQYLTSSPNHNTGLPIIPNSELEDSLLGDVGDNLHYDSNDNRIFNNISNLAGNYISNENEVGGYSSLSLKTRESSYDSDNDGMADDWEIRTFGTLSKKHNEDENGDGYTNLEEFLHSLTVTL